MIIFKVLWLKQTKQLFWKMRVQLKNQIIEVPILVSEGYDTEELRVSVRADAMIWSEENSFMVLKYDYNQKS